MANKFSYVNMELKRRHHFNPPDCVKCIVVINMIIESILIAFQLKMMFRKKIKVSGRSEVPNRYTDCYLDTSVLSASWTSPHSSRWVSSQVLIPTLECIQDSQAASNWQNPLWVWSSHQVFYFRREEGTSVNGVLTTITGILLGHRR